MKYQIDVWIKNGVEYHFQTDSVGWWSSGSDNQVQAKDVHGFEIDGSFSRLSITSLPLPQEEPA